MQTNEKLKDLETSIDAIFGRIEGNNKYVESVFTHVHDLPHLVITDQYPDGITCGGCCFLAYVKYKGVIKDSECISERRKLFAEHPEQMEKNICSPACMLFESV